MHVLCTLAVGVVVGVRLYTSAACDAFLNMYCVCVHRVVVVVVLMEKEEEEEKEEKEGVDTWFGNLNTKVKLQTLPGTCTTCISL